jgi:hypothetical protein
VDISKILDGEKTVNSRDEVSTVCGSLCSVEQGKEAEIRAQLGIRKMDKQIHETTTEDAVRKCFETTFILSTCKKIGPRKAKKKMA